MRAVRSSMSVYWPKKLILAKERMVVLPKSIVWYSLGKNTGGTKTEHSYQEGKKRTGHEPADDEIREHEKPKQ